MTSLIRCETMAISGATAGEIISQEMNNQSSQN